MSYYTEYNKPNMAGAKLIKVERNKLNPLPYGLTFVSIAYWKLNSGETIGVVF